MDAPFDDHSSHSSDDDDTESADDSNDWALADIHMTQPKRQCLDKSSMASTRRLSDLLSFEHRMFHAVSQTSPTMHLELKNAASHSFAVTKSYAATCAGSVALSRAHTYLQEYFGV